MKEMRGFYGRSNERNMGGAFRLVNALRRAFTEKAHKDVVASKIRSSGLGVVLQRPTVVFCDNVSASDYIAGDHVIVERRAAGTPTNLPVPKCRNDLTATGKSLCLATNFARSKAEIRRIAAQARS
jgi:hypothetical protein